MAEQLASLKTKGSTGKITINVNASGGNGTGNPDHNAFAYFSGAHTFKNLKVIGYTNLSSAYGIYPTITVDGTESSKPAIGTVFDITGKSFSIRSTTIVKNWTQVGVTVELS